MIPVIKEDVALVVRLQDGEEELILDIGRDYYSSALAVGSHGSKTDFLVTLNTDYSFSPLGILRRNGVVDVGMEAMSQELPDQGHLTVTVLGGVPDVGLPFSMALPISPLARERPLDALVHHSVALDY